MVKYPGDWKIYEFDDVFHILPNNTLSRDKLTTRGNIGNIHYGDVLIKYGIILTANDDIPKIKPECESSAKIFLRKNDIIIADTAEDETVGKAVQIGDVDIPLVAGLHTIPCRPVMPTAPGYLGYYINSKAYHDQLLPYITGIKVSSISKASIRKTLIPLPTLKEQTAIADTLAAFDTHISNLPELIAKKKAIRDGALDELMTGRTRLKGFCGEWKMKTLGEVCKIFDGTHQTPKYTSMGIKFVSVENIRDIYKSEKYISIDDYNRDFKIYPQKGDILMTRIGDIGTPCIVSQDDPIAYYVSLALLKNISINNAYLYYHIQGRAFQKELYDRTLHHATPKKINKGEIGKCFVIIPPLDEQKAIADTLTALDTEISSLEAERAKISNIRDGAMNDLLTGKVRLIHGNRKTAPEPRNSLASR